MKIVIVLDGIYYALGLAAGGALVAWLAGPWFSTPLWILAAFCLYFFRDPEREIPSGPIAVSPADGKVVAVKAESPTVNRISIFLNIFDVHVNRTPIGGQA
jgi:phosphatidylserine decarboxylase